MADTIRVVLDDRGFADLVNGKPIQLRGQDGTLVELILSDIGFDRMLRHIIWQHEPPFDI